MGVGVCPIHQAEFKCSSLHVAGMLNPRGQKRKHEEEDSAQIRLTLLDVTYDKIKRTQAERNPTLERQVLLTNVVRRLRDSFEKDGIRVNGLTRDSLEPVWAHTNNQVSNLDPPPGNDLMLPSEPLEQQQYRCLMEVDEQRPSTPFVRSSTDWTDDDRLSSLNWSSVLKSGTSFADDTTSASDDPATSLHVLMNATTLVAETPSCNTNTPETSLHVLMPATTVAMETTSCSSSSTSATTSDVETSYSSRAGSTSPSSSEDEIFADVDLTLYDYDYSPLSPPSQVGGGAAPLTAEELMWSLSNDQKDALRT